MASQKGLPSVLALYRQILRAHRKQLPPPMRVLGDGYASLEFRQHLEGKTTQKQWREFGAEWSKYLGAIDPGGTAGGAANLSGQLSAETIANMSDEQRATLEKLRLEAMSFGTETTMEEDEK
mgnify:CR=1 FL=1|jgi:hypothetical protein|tara:strand:- start:2691 stop:3056 length:366 start_codon:yes stop_codon:yes gene_type:complete|mmetsp:Transcript_569/g.1921  ORF Transcript_569/g.1921 Transcript_569/m.1921 type:complete len:122 (-) Transcript_569:121-486(-)|eukprot:CAMPEP_0119208282 /NCGR_PEP_ID=MMETSP1327-20130426/522_1 /TAXON_ID=38833 /ORGANISM="Micromonas pusilla, Strain RCC2306" /LENGTH=121 /DNA_ID=CAMNT_0007204761 /DNA_START=477 /DNA_END=842 /DNA_ORIENTATION=+